VTSVVGLFLLGGLLGAVIAFVYQAYRDGRRLQALVVGAVGAAIVTYLVWAALMAGSVGPAMRG